MRSRSGVQGPFGTATFTAQAGARRVVGAALASLTVILVAATAACGTTEGSGSEWQEDFVLPPEIRGLWITNDPRYDDRALELQADAVVFHTGGIFGISAHHIRQGRRRDGNRPGTLYELRYRSDSPAVLYTFAFYYRSEDGGKIRFENQPGIVWSRADQPG